MKESASHGLGAQIFLGRELAPQTSLCRFFMVRGQIQFQSNRELRESPSARIVHCLCPPVGPGVRPFMSTLQSS